MQESNPTKTQIRLPLILAGVLALGMYIGGQLPHYDKNLSFTKGNSSPSGAFSGTIDEIMRYIDARYVDTVSTNELKNEAINHLLEKLDPHSVYISPDELSAVNEDMSGNFQGIGIEFLLVEDTIQVVSPISGGPSESVGIMAGDKIVKIGDSIVAGIHIDNGRIFKLLRGEKGSKIGVSILRGQEKQLRDFVITRDIIPVHSLDIAYMLDEKTGYVKISKFSATTYQEFMEALRPMAENQGMENLVIDLRGNPGGYLNEATNILSQFFAEGKLLVYTKGRTEDRRDYKSNGRARFKIDNVAVLIDEGSASASEIVAGAIQDHDRGWIIGRRSFGKGLVQEQYPLKDGGALRLTIARYYTPSGRCIQRDYKHTNQYDGEADRRLKSGELMDASKMRIADSTKFYTVMGRIVYSSGAITPDVFIPLDTSFANQFYFDVRGHLNEFTAKHLEIHPKSEFPNNLKDFIANYNVSDAILDEMVAYAIKNKTKPNPASLLKCKSELKLQFKARLAKNLFKEEGLFSVINADDPAIDKALQIMKKGQRVGEKVEN
jgi:carboxyl-terminal processing protease